MKTTEQHNQEYDHDHSHNHAHSHSHALTPLSDQGHLRTKFGVGLVISLLFVVIEFGAGLLSNSLALLSDAGHNLSDGLALVFSLVALVLARRAPTRQKTFGFHRAGILAASLNSLTLVFIGVVILFEGGQRLFNPPAVESWTVVIVAAVALVVNLGIGGLLHREAQNDLNVRSAFVHLMTDAAASVGVIVAGTAQAVTGWRYFDPLASLLIGLLILWSSWGIIKQASNVLLEGIPEGLNIEAVAADLKRLAGVSEVHDLHAWSIGSGLPLLSVHLQMLPTSSLQQVTQTVQTANTLLDQKYHIRHATIQVECERCEAPCQMDF